MEKEQIRQQHQALLGTANLHEWAAEHHMSLARQAALQAAALTGQYPWLAEPETPPTD